ncbi:hypothetical protein [Paucibacter sp. Y2R2-4]|uniref:hypothetical protein n=1 Tax=Paucibacter sp. Y2R2-4 TaxID=2893553 RepID=UPI0021E3DAA7|nr:hypothetical protein [Paucibacter sp. Y2R2-4]MCV2349351.1 hypothetical protein [Paucibacter sp. Y2R2-4]
MKALQKQQSQLVLALRLWPVLISGFGVSRGWAFYVTLGLATFSSSPSALVLSSAIDICASALRVHKRPLSLGRA